LPSCYIPLSNGSTDVCPHLIHKNLCATFPVSRSYRIEFISKFDSIEYSRIRFDIRSNRIPVTKNHVLELKKRLMPRIVI